MGTERESACLFFFFFNFSIFLVHNKIRLGMHDSFLSFQVLFPFFRQDIQVGTCIYPPQKFSREVYIFFPSFIMYLGGLQVYG